MDSLSNVWGLLMRTITPLTWSQEQDSRYAAHCARAILDRVHVQQRAASHHSNACAYYLSDLRTERWT